MNKRQLQYAVALSRTLNISQTAENLKITQPALSKQILALEKEFGIALFDRSTTPLKMTPAGEKFIKLAEEILIKEENLISLMQDFKEGKKGRLVIGISPFRAGYFLLSTIKKLQEKYPGLQIVLKEAGSDELRAYVLDGTVDFAIINLPVEDVLLDVIPLNSEPLALVVPNKMAEGKKGLNLADCKDFPFIALGKNQELRKLFEKLCSVNGFTPNISVEATGITTAWSIAQAGIGATVLPKRFTEEHKTESKVLVFELNGEAYIRKPAIVIRKGQYLSKYAADAIEFIKKEN